MGQPDTTPPVTAPTPQVLQRRADFLRAAQARKVGTPAFLLQARERRPDEPLAGVRVGFTCSKKVGNAVARNRAKRRLREAARAVVPALGRPGWDYVLIGRRDVTAARNFAVLTEDLRRALASAHAARDGDARRNNADGGEARRKGAPDAPGRA